MPHSYGMALSFDVDAAIANAEAALNAAMLSAEVTQRGRTIKRQKITDLLTTIKQLEQMKSQASGGQMCSLGFQQEPT